MAYSEAQSFYFSSLISLNEDSTFTTWFRLCLSPGYKLLLAAFPCCGAGRCCWLISLFGLA